MTFPATLSIVDVETTGLSPTYDKIIEIGILRVDHGRIVEEFESFINPHCSLPREITHITGIQQKQVDTAPSFHDIKHTIRHLLQDALFVAHNAAFDYAFIQSEFWRLDEPFVQKTLCTAKLSRRLFPMERRHNLDSIMRRFDLFCPTRHRALSDAKVLWEFMKRISPMTSEHTIANIIR